MSHSVAFIEKATVHLRRNDFALSLELKP